MVEPVLNGLIPFEDAFLQALVPLNAPDFEVPVQFIVVLLRVVGDSAQVCSDLPVGERDIVSGP
jgi:hypothetical protein